MVIMGKKLQPGDRFNRYQARKKVRVVRGDIVAKKSNQQLVDLSTKKKVAIMGLV